jgi:peptidyl-prolyl cis-trans isomerase C
VTAAAAALVNGVPLSPRDGETTELAAARELMRQRAVAVGLADPSASDEDEINAAIEALLEREVSVPEPTEDECRRYYDQHPLEFDTGELVHARHILFQVTPGVNVTSLRARAEEALNTLLRQPDRFAAMARELSNCSSGQQDGNLGQIGRGDMVPEFEKALFRFGPTGILRELVKTRHGLHIVAVDRRIPGNKLPFEMVREDIAERLRSAVEEKALRQYVSVLAGQADLTGVDLDGTAIPLVQ